MNRRILALLWLIVPLADRLGAQETRPVPAPGTDLIEGPRAVIAIRALGTDARWKTVGDFQIMYHADVEPLIPLALETALQVHEDVAEWCRRHGAPLQDASGRHVALFTKDYAAHRAAVSYESVKSVRQSLGYYDDRNRLLFWFDQRTGPQAAVDRQSATANLAGIERSRAELERARNEGRDYPAGLLGHPIPQRTHEETESFLRMMADRFRKEQLAVAAPAYGLSLLRHEITHQLFYEHGLMGQPTSAWLSEGTAMAFEEVERSDGVLRPAVNRRHLGNLRIWLARQGAIDARNREHPYVHERIARALDLREMVQNNLVVEDQPEIASAYYARYWAFTYYLMEKRPQDLVASLQRSREQVRDQTPDPQPHVANFERVFGRDYERLSSDMAAFLAETMTRADERALVEEAAWRESEARMRPAP